MGKKYLVYSYDNKHLFTLLVPKKGDPEEPVILSEGGGVLVPDGRLGTSKILRELRLYRTVFTIVGRSY